MARGPITVRNRKIIIEIAVGFVKNRTAISIYVMKESLYQKMQNKRFLKYEFYKRVKKERIYKGFCDQPHKYA